MSDTAHIRFLVVRAGGEELALPLALVRGAFGAGRVEPIPGAPPHVAGMLMVDSRMVPVVDLRVRLGLSPPQPVERSTAVIVEFASKDGPAILGLLVDKVLEVVTPRAGDVRPVSGPNAQPHVEAVVRTRAPGGTKKRLLLAPARLFEPKLVPFRR